MKYRIQIISILFGIFLGWQLHGLLVTVDHTEVRQTTASDSGNADSVHHNVPSLVTRRQPAEQVAERPQQAVSTVSSSEVVMPGNEQDFRNTLINVDHARKAGLADEALSIIDTYLETNYNDVRALRIKAEILALQGETKRQIEVLYTARSYAWQEAVIDRIQRDIRNTVNSYQQQLKKDNKNVELLSLYQNLTYLEPDYNC